MKALIDACKPHRHLKQFPATTALRRDVYERMAAIPDKLYGADLKSNYQAQGLKLSKHFKVG